MASNDGGYAFPRPIAGITEELSGTGITSDEQSGMSLRDYFAAQALAGMLGCQDFVNDICKTSASKDEARKKLADWAYKQADAMLFAREQS